jgi:2-oxoglutarate-Fe(II)-dependent dioxygenase family protein
MRELVLSRRLSESETDALEGSQLDDKSYDVVLREDTRVLREDGTPLLIYRRRVLDPALCETAFQVLRTIKQHPGNRYTATLGYSPKSSMRSRTRIITRRMLEEQGLGDASSAVIGAFDRYQRYPYCRLTAFNLAKAPEFLRVMPYIQAVNAVFQQEVPERYAAQLAMIQRTHPEWIIHGTAFTTVTVNKNYPTRVHKDAGDLKAGFGVMSVLRAGTYRGGLFVMPAWRVALDAGTGDVFLADVHEWHGNTRLMGKRGSYERVSCVFYYREKMHECGSTAEELQRAKQVVQRRLERHASGA